MAKIKPRVKVPKKADAGEVITIKALISHPMHTGRKDAVVIKIINEFRVSFNGQQVFNVMMEPAVSANPFVLKASESGTISHGLKMAAKSSPHLRR